jgi:hypothetical protein
MAARHRAVVGWIVHVALRKVGAGISLGEETAVYVDCNNFGAMLVGRMLAGVVSYC